MPARLEDYGLRPIFPEVIDSSMLKDFVDCPRKFYYRHVLGLRKKHLAADDIAHLDWGTLWHLLMEVYNTTGDPVQALRALDNRRWPSSLVAEIDKHGRSKTRMIQFFLEYVERFSDHDEMRYETVRNEQFFDVFNEELGIRWSGRIDKIVRRKGRRGSSYLVWDYKTTSRMGPNFFAQYEYSFQLPGYVWAVNQLLTEPVYEIEIDVLYTLKASHDFFRRPIRYSQPQLDEWVRNTKQILERMYYLRDHHLHNPDAWTLHWNECTRYGLCQFSDVCFTPPNNDDRLIVLGDDYVEDRWNPLEREVEVV